MSRHRNIRNLNLDDELDSYDDDDDYYYDEGGDYDEDDYTYDPHRPQTVASFLETSDSQSTARGPVNLLNEVKAFVGAEFPDSQIQEALRRCNNNVEQAVNFVFDEGPRLAPPPGFAPRTGPQGIEVASQSEHKGLTIAESDDDGLSFRTVYPVMVISPMLCHLRSPQRKAIFHINAEGGRDQEECKQAAPYLERRIRSSSKSSPSPSFLPKPELPSFVPVTVTSLHSQTQRAPLAPLGATLSTSGNSGSSLSSLPSAVPLPSLGKTQSALLAPLSSSTLGPIAPLATMLSGPSLPIRSLGSVGQLTAQAGTISSGSDAIKRALAELSEPTGASMSAQYAITLGTPASSQSTTPSPIASLGASLVPLQKAPTVIPVLPRADARLLSLSSASSLAVEPVQARKSSLTAAPSVFAKLFTTHRASPTANNVSYKLLISSLFTPSEVSENDPTEPSPFKFETPSPDDVVRRARSGTGKLLEHKKASSKQTPRSAVNRESAQPVKSLGSMDQLQMDISGLNLGPSPPMIRSSSTASLASSSSGLPSPPAIAKSASGGSAKMPKIKKVDIMNEFAKREKTKESLNLVVVGHVDAGKSTLMGHLLYLLGEVTDRVMKKYERDAEKLKKSSFAFAWVLDSTDEERSRGVTIDVGMSHFQTKTKKFTLLDAPGHRDFVPNVMSGASQADCAVLVVDATIGEFETGFEEGGQTREHAILIRSLGVGQLIVAVNKLEVTEWDQGRFNEIKDKLSPFLNQVGFRKNKLWFVPTSGFTGENLIKRSNNKLTCWYTGPTLVEQIDAFTPPSRPVDGPFRVSVADYFKGGISGGGAGNVSVSGRIESGTVQVGEGLLVLPVNEIAIVKALEVSEASVKWAAAGDNVLMSLTGIDMLAINTGSILCDPSAPLPVTTHFKAQIITFDIHIPLTPGVPVVLHHQSMTTQATLTKLHSLLDRSTQAMLKKNPRAIPKNSTAIVEIKTERPICLEVFAKSKELGRLVLRRGAESVGAGIILEILRFEKMGV